MDIWETDKLALFIAFVIPGFIILKIYELLYPSEKKETSGQVIDAITYSCINYALLSWPILQIESSDIATSSPGLYATFYMFVLLVAPISWAFVWMLLRNTDFLKKHFHHPVSKAWDYVFSKRKSYWVIVTLKDGRKIGGKYDSKSFASSSPSPEQLYIEEVWEINNDGGFERCLIDTAGILVLAPEISTVEFIKQT